MATKRYTVTAVSDRADMWQNKLNVSFLYISNNPHKQSRLCKQKRPQTGWYRKCKWSHYIAILLAVYQLTLLLDNEFKYNIKSQISHSMFSPAFKLFYPHVPRLRAWTFSFSDLFKAPLPSHGPLLSGYNRKEKVNAIFGEGALLSEFYGINLTLPLPRVT